jgi:hypothetical protein
MQQPLESPLQQAMGGHHGIDQTVFASHERCEGCALENHVTSPAHADQAGQASATAPCGHQTQLRLRQADARSGIIAGDAVIACQGQLEAASEAGSVDGGGFGQSKICHKGEHPLTRGDQLAYRFRRAGQHGVEIRSGNEDLGLGTTQEQAFEIPLLSHPEEMAFQFSHGFPGENISGTARRIEDEMANALIIDQALEGFWRGDGSSS